MHVHVRMYDSVYDCLFLLKDKTDKHSKFLFETLIHLRRRKFPAIIWYGRCLCSSNRVCVSVLYVYVEKILLDYREYWGRKLRNIKKLTMTLFRLIPHSVKLSVLIGCIESWCMHSVVKTTCLFSCFWLLISHTYIHVRLYDEDKNRVVGVNFLLFLYVGEWEKQGCDYWPQIPQTDYWN